MNIFVVDENPAAAARDLHDAHVVKMILESAQMMSSALWAHGQSAPYRQAYKSHPCTLWVGTARDNFEWISCHALALADEYERRFKRVHASRAVVTFATSKAYVIPAGALSPHPLAMPDVYRGDRTSAPTALAVQLYRGYYRAMKLTPRKKPATWTGRTPPEWTK